jgi:hypothetical protein
LLLDTGKFFDGWQPYVIELTGGFSIGESPKQFLWSDLRLALQRAGLVKLHSALPERHE